MNPRKFILFIFILASGFFINSCSKKAPKEIKRQKQPPYLIAVTLYPQKALVNYLLCGKSVCPALQSRVLVKSVVKPGENPKIFSPKPSIINEFKNAKIYFTLSLPFEDSLKKVFPQTTLIVDTSQGTHFLYLGASHQLNKDPHIWLSPDSLKLQLKIIFQTLLANLPPFVLGVAKDIQKNEILHKNYTKTINLLEDVIKEASHIMAPCKGEVRLVYHPAFGYFLHYFGLQQISIEEGKRVSVVRLRNLPKIIKKYHIHAVYVQRETQFFQLRNILPKHIKIIRLATIPMDPILYIKHMALSFCPNKRGL